MTSFILHLREIIIIIICPHDKKQKETLSDVRQEGRRGVGVKRKE